VGVAHGPPHQFQTRKRLCRDVSHLSLGELIESKVLNNEQLTVPMAKVTGVPYVNLTSVTIDNKTLQLLPRETAERYMAVPLGIMQKRLAVAMIDAYNVQAVDFLEQKIGQALKIYMASEEGIRHVLEQYPTDISAHVNEAVTSAAIDTESLKEIAKNNEGPKKADGLVISQDSPISRVLNSVLEYAARSNASDIHIEPTEKELKIRCRIDGILREVMVLPKEIEPAFISRIKILSNLKIDEHRVPQDGQFTVHTAGKDIDLRIAVSPVVWGEQVVIRLLDKTGASFKLEEMGYTGRALRAIRKGIKKPNGMVLTSGPTGSGKSTSLYALVQEIFDESINIVTLEDPVEYKMAGVNQIQVNAEVGLTFASGLRSILRQDPNVVLVGEIRDKETAGLAVQAALTGHLVFSTLHTNSAAGVLTRLLDMGIEPFLLSSSLLGVVAQRLVRKLCSHCKQHEAGVWKAVGCEHCGHTGYQGRVGVYELLLTTEAISAQIHHQSSEAEIRLAAQKDGMKTMREDGQRWLDAGVTTREELLRVTKE